MKCGFNFLTSIIGLHRFLSFLLHCHDFSFLPPGRSLLKPLHFGESNSETSFVRLLKMGGFAQRGGKRKKMSLRRCRGLVTSAKRGEGT